jgi:hypothetical protein
MKTVGTIAIGAALLASAPVQARGWGGGHGGGHWGGGHGGGHWGGGHGGGHWRGGGHWGGGHNWNRGWGRSHWRGGGWGYYPGYWGGGWGGYDGGDVAIAGILGLAAGAAIASDRYDDGYDDWGYDPYDYPGY